MKIKFVLVLITILLVNEVNVFSQNSTGKFRKQYYKVKELLYYRKFQEALPLVLELDEWDKFNPNINYLAGVCYLGTNTENEKAIQRLEYAANYISIDYDAAFSKEKSTPIYANYYLGIAYANAHRCEDAKKAFESFIARIDEQERVWNTYVKDCEERMKECKSKPEEPVTENIPSDKDTLHHQKYQAYLAKKDSLARINDPRKNLTTREIMFTTSSSLWAVQVGAFAKNVPSTNFPNLKNVQSFIDNDGMIRYVIGNSTYRSIAEGLKKEVVAAGYADAFIVDINKEKKYSKEVLHEEKRKRTGKVEYRVQIGAFRNQIPEHLAKEFLKIDNVKETRQGDLTILTAGNFKTYQEAEQLKKMIINQGLEGAFVIPFVNGQKITFKEADEYLNKK
jgi:cell division septation protein DedD